MPQKLLLLISMAFLLIILSESKEEDLYKILGVSRTASVKEIKSAYRRKALDTHPDKNKDGNAAEAFQRVVNAFEILSDDQSRRNYDRTGSAEQAQRQPVVFHWNFHRRPLRMKDRRDVQEAQSRILHVVSLEQLETVMLDDNQLLERNLLICVVVPGDVEQIADDEIVFPYPFAGMSSQGIWWEDMLQTIKIRLYRSNELQLYLGLPHGEEIRASKQPIFLFGKRGTHLSAVFPRIQSSSRQEVETWIWDQMKVELEFENRHAHAVEIYWVHGSQAQQKLILQPFERAKHTSMMSHEWYIRDVRVDARPDAPNRNKLTIESSLGNYKIVNDTSPQIITIEAQSCFDLSGHCSFWKYQGECHKNPEFMREVCFLTCELCTRKIDGDTIHDEL